MNKSGQFTQMVEKLVDPIEVGSIHFIHGLNKLLPKSIQDKMSKSAYKKSPYLGFVVEPYSYFLAYEVADLEQASAMLPEGFKLIKTKVFEDDEPFYCAIIGCFRVHTSAFWGSRSELYLIAENEETGLLTWVILDYLSNTISQDNRFGIRSPNSKETVVTINHRGRLFVNFEDKFSPSRVSFDSDVTKGEMKPIDQRLWLEGNLSVAYGKDLKGSTDTVFGLKFEPCEVERALFMPPESINIESQTWFSNIVGDQPVRMACFPYAQHFVSDINPNLAQINNKEQLVEEVGKLIANNPKPVSVKGLRGLVFAQTILVFLLGSLVVFLLLVR